MNLRVFLVAGVALACAQTASAALIASDDFQAYGTGNLAGQNGGTGWGGAWGSAGGSPQVVDPAVDLDGNRAARFSQNNNNIAYRSLATSQSGNVIIDFLLQVQIPAGAALGNNDFLALWFDSAASGDHTNRPNLGLKANCGTGSCTDDIFVRTTGTAGSFAPGSNLASDTTVRVFGHLYKSSSSNYNRFDLWFNPTAAEMASLTGWDASYSGNSGISSFSTLGFRTANLDGGVTATVDNLRLSSVPEPGTLALLGLGLAGLAATRRRKQ